MAIIETKRAAERHLLALTPAVPTAFEGVTFNPPTGIYQRLQFIIRQPDDPVLGKGYYRERLSMQVFICAELNKGTAEAITRAELVRNWFTKGTTLQEGNIRIHVLTTPQITGTIVTQDRLVCPVIIELVAEVYSA